MGEHADWINEDGEMSDLVDGPRIASPVCVRCGREGEMRDDECTAWPVCVDWPECVAP